MDRVGKLQQLNCERRQNQMGSGHELPTTQQRTLPQSYSVRVGRHRAKLGSLQNFLFFTGNKAVSYTHLKNESEY